MLLWAKLHGLTKLKPHSRCSPKIHSPVLCFLAPNPTLVDNKRKPYSPVPSSRLQPQIQPKEEAAGMPPHRSALLDPPIQVREEGAGVARRRSTRLNPQIEATEDGAGIAPRRSPRLHPQIHAREEGTSPAAAASLPDNDDMLREILIRLPPRPSSLPRVSAVCKRWRGLVTDAKFLCSFRVHHRKPPLLGVFQDSNQGIVFTPVLDRPDRIHPQRFDFGRYSGNCRCPLLDCRHGRVLVQDLAQDELVVCDPITGEQRCIAIPSKLKRGYLEGAVLCAASDHGHVHGGCLSCSYRVVLVSMADDQCLVCVYTFETGVWGNLISTEAPYEPVYADVPATLVGNCLYWSTGDHILEFDLDRQNLAVIMGSPVTDDILDGHRQIIHATDGAVGVAILSDPHLEMWKRNVNVHGVATWMPWKTIEMHIILGLPFQVESQVGGKKFIRGYDEDTGIIFLQVDNSVYMVQLKSTESTKLSDTLGAYHHHPFKSFYTPGTAIRGCDEADMLHDP